MNNAVMMSQFGQSGEPESWREAITRVMDTLINIKENEDISLK